MFCLFECSDLYVPYLENDGRAGFLLQDTGSAEWLEVRVGVVEEVGVVVDQQCLDIVEDEAKFIRVLHRVQAWVVLRHQGGSEAAHAGCVQHLTHLGSVIRRKEKRVKEKTPFLRRYER